MTPERLAELRQLATNLGGASVVPELVETLNAVEERDKRIAELERDRDMWRGECASISEEIGLPPTIRPADGEFRKAWAARARVAELERERDNALVKSKQYEQDWCAAKSEFGTAMGKMRERMRALEAALREMHTCAITIHSGATCTCVGCRDAVARANELLKLTEDT